ncbi:2-iminoacetate synthase ThiH [Acerihabitans sp. KWT182]|uniref:2-iminoacetate synthase n=1 Tax=Acerihabitans sp. KWT182 TaxID=3157919 RepID=A0AAU7QEZ8_9GAMM
MMNSFYNRWQCIQWDNTGLKINARTAEEVERALTADRPDLNDFMALLSPAAMPYLEPLAQRAQRLTRQRFGNVVNLYLPLYLSNLCSNDCTYCGFSMSNRLRRKTLDEREIIAECQAIRDRGFENVLLVTGEHQSKVGMDYFRRYVPLIRDYFSSLMMEVQPLSQENYAELKTLGLDGVMVYQETYHQPTYQLHHLRGQKMDFAWRLETPDRLAWAGIDKIGLGALIGLSDNWRTDCYMVAEHLLYLQKKALAKPLFPFLPRLRPCAGGITPASIMDESQLLQVMCAFRLLAPDVEISLSTRESPWFRDHAVPIVVNSVSAGSKTQPGGYAGGTPELEQFEPHDNRSVREVEHMLLQSGLQPVWKDWDRYLGRNAARSL